MHYIYSRANSNGRAALRMYHELFPDQPMPHHRIFLRLHRQIPDTFFLVTRYDAGQRRAVYSPSLEESLFNVVADTPESSTKVVAHHVKCESSDRL
ncbi:hypothetical protein TNCV_3035921 [Trichonephila clavipes]|nr:hypothetical protein TNCV_3035921 [Trichonephila clavipes]